MLENIHNLEKNNKKIFLAVKTLFFGLFWARGGFLFCCVVFVFVFVFVFFFGLGGVM
jgi:hypothetical protein